MVRDLGIWLDEKIVLQRTCTPKSERRLEILKRNFRNLSTEAFVTLYKNILRSQLEYGTVVVWFSLV